MNNTNIINALDLHCYNNRIPYDYIKIYDNFLQPKICDYLIDFFEKNKKYHHNNKTIGDTFKEKKYFKKNNEVKEFFSARLSKGISIDNLIKENTDNKEYKFVFDIIFNIFDKGLKLYLKTIPNRTNIKKFTDEGYFITKYEKKSGFYKWHTDRSFMSNKAHKRYISAIFYLNTVENGGETEFKFHNKIVKAKKGRLLIFPSDWIYTHRGKIPISENKYICNNFFTLF